MSGAGFGAQRPSLDCLPLLVRAQGLHQKSTAASHPSRAYTVRNQKVSDADQGTAPGSSSTLPSSDSCSQAPCRLMEPWNARTTTAWSPSTVYTRDGDDQEDHDQVLLTTDPINMAQTVPSVRSPVNADGDSRCTRASPAESACVSDAISKSTELPLHREAHVSGVIAHSPAKPGRLYMRPLERRSEQQ